VRAIPVTESSQIAEARREAAHTATAQGFDETDTGRVAIVASELATNLIKHGGGGELLVASYDDPSGTGVELIALDRGRGIADLQACLRDGYSSAGSAGHGLGAIRRQSQVMEIVSWPERGTAVMARLSVAPARNEPPPVPAWGCVCIPLSGEEVSGDACAAAETDAGRTLIVVDGLGHGSQAAIASSEALRLFQRNQSLPITELLQHIHAGLRSTRGAAVALARFDRGESRVVYGGIGNVAGAVVSAAGMKRMISLNGIAGHGVRKIQSFDYAYTSGLVVMHSDGLATSWSLERYPGLINAHPTLIAAVLYRDFARRRDDVAVMVASGMPPS
jgi:anti-sigma regulatory factor (Ser/Thr protein kinase)